MPPFLTPLGSDELRATGIPAPWSYGQADRVRFHELDALRHVNNVVYLSWFEAVRVGWFASRGISHYSDADPTFVLRQVSATYHKPMFLNDEYIVTARCESFRTSSFVKAYAVWRGGELTAEGTTVVVMTDADGVRKVPLTDEMQRALVEMDGATRAG